MELKNKIDVLAKRADITNKKITILLIVISGIWIYGIKSENNMLFISSVFLFFTGSIFLLLNFLNLDDIDKQLKELIDA